MIGRLLGVVSTLGWLMGLLWVAPMAWGLGGWPRAALAVGVLAWLDRAWRLTRPAPRAPSWPSYAVPGPSAGACPCCRRPW